MIGEMGLQDSISMNEFFWQHENTMKRIRKIQKKYIFSVLKVFEWKEGECFFPELDTFFFSQIQNTSMMTKNKIYRIFNQFAKKDHSTSHRGS